nr:restriction endonuclease subunit S [Neobacillus sp. Marseille-Q6967]
MSSNILRIRFIDDINPYYVKYFLNSPQGKKALNDIKSATTNIAAIYAKNLYSVMIPVPTLEEQDRIVEVLDRILNIENKINFLVNSKASINDMVSVILSKAFRSELGTNDRSEENVVELLKEEFKKQVN